MKKLLFIAILMFGSSSCTEDQFLFSQDIAANIIKIGPANPAYLLISNRLEENSSITSWSMTGYQFKDLDISIGEANQFILVNSMPEGYKDLTVTLFFTSSTSSFSLSDKVNFIAGGITKITVSGCEECGGYRIESSW